VSDIGATAPILQFTYALSIGSDRGLAADDSTPRIIARDGRVDSYLGRKRYQGGPEADSIRTICSATGPHATQFRTKSGA
jgi:hypothetical protein